MGLPNSNDILEGATDDRKTFFTLSSSFPDPAGVTRCQQVVQAENSHPLDVSELFKIPEDVSPAWQAFFDKVAAYLSKQCAKSKDAIVQLKKRSSIMKEENLSEFEMLMCSADFTQSANMAFKAGNYFEALALYTEAVHAFPTPDAMNNAAACALKLKKFRSADNWATESLEIDLLCPTKAAKAYHRRATARHYRGKFAAALEDIIDANRALALNPGDPSVESLIVKIQETVETVKTSKDLAKYRAKQPKPVRRTSVPGTHAHRQSDGTPSRHSRLNKAQELQMKTRVDPPTF
ncbi:hypothetical protein CPB83DRAFT_831770 [Crepidotus variabilis]|uniref:Uncharacterized protein n=1 Tax=Crepidotus variabilis TaxID=179855 RepID=A0A9P6EQ41_9AGAR|nr:hypothetical protein CPB83DRAFT_831770 [Crepidotus variabilis]